MSDKEKDLNNEMKQIDLRLSNIDEEINNLEYQKQQLISRRTECKKLLKDFLPSSSGGNKDDKVSNWNRNDFSWSSNVNALLKNVFNLNSFRPLQLETINVTLSREDCIVILPTGGGKSLCFQLPSLVENSITLVVSPLVSLVEDQLWILKSLNIKATTLNATSSKEHIKLVHTQMTDPKSDLKILYVTPEKLAKSKMFMNKLEKMYELDRFVRLVIDEVHCCSTYGNDFRPDYKFLGIMKRLFPKVCILGLTATATQTVIDDVKNILNIQKSILFKSTFNRPNIFYEVREKPSNNEAFIKEISTLINKEFPNQSGIVYTFSQRESEQVALDLRSRGIKADAYHAQLDSDRRSNVHEKWLNNKVHVIVATIAFGMGIDKNNCRFVIHHSLSKSLENFYQESGRAGRDGLPAYSILYFRYADVFRQSSLVFTEATGLQNLYSIVSYCIDQASCKRSLVAKHFNDLFWNRNGKCNKMCDYCKNESNKKIETVNCIKEAQLIVEILSRHVNKEKRLTANKLSELVLSEISSKSNKPNYSNNLRQNELEVLILTLLMKGYLKEDFHFTPYNTIVYLINGNKSSSLKYEKQIDINLNRNASQLKRDFSQLQIKENSCKSEKIENHEEILVCEDNNENNNDDIYVLDFDDDDFCLKEVKYKRSSDSMAADDGNKKFKQSVH